MRLSAAPGTTSARTFDVNVNGTSATFDCQILSGGTSCFDIAVTTPANAIVTAGQRLTIISDVQNADAALSRGVISFTCD